MMHLPPLHLMIPSPPLPLMIIWFLYHRMILFHLMIQSPLPNQDQIIPSSPCHDPNPSKDPNLPSTSHPPQNGLTFWNNKGPQDNAQDVGTSSIPPKSKFPSYKSKSCYPSSSASILGPYVPNLNPSFLPSILGPYVPMLNPPSLPSILGPYIPPSTTPSPQIIPKQDQQRHTTLDASQHSLSTIPSIKSINPSPLCTNPIAIGSNLDAQSKNHKAQNPQKSKDQHVPSKQNKNVIRKKEKSKRPQMPQKKTSKTMWIPKVKSKLASNVSNPKAPSIHRSSNPPSNTPSSSKSILGPYVPESTIPTPSSPSSILGHHLPKSTLYSPSNSKHSPPLLHHPSRCVPMLIFHKFFKTPSIIHHPLFTIPFR